MLLTKQKVDAENNSWILLMLHTRICKEKEKYVSKDKHNLNFKKVTKLFFAKEKLWHF